MQSIEISAPVKLYKAYVISVGHGLVYYTGIAIDPMKRFKEHCSGKGAVCFRAWRNCNWSLVWMSPTRLLKGMALRAERMMKSLPSIAKEDAGRIGLHNHSVACECALCQVWSLWTHIEGLHNCANQEIKNRP